MVPPLPSESDFAFMIGMLLAKASPTTTCNHDDLILYIEVRLKIIGNNIV